MPEKLPLFNKDEKFECYRGIFTIIDIKKTDTNGFILYKYLVKYKDGFEEWLTQDYVVHLKSKMK
jgi:hypothetical protein